MTDTPVVPAAADSTWAKIVAWARKCYANTLEPLWVWWHNKVAANPKTTAISLIVLALFALR